MNPPPSAPKPSPLSKKAKVKAASRKPSPAKGKASKKATKRGDGGQGSAGGWGKSSDVADKIKTDEAAIASWMVGPARNLDLRSIVEGLGRLCLVRGLPFHRIHLYSFAIHPQLLGHRYQWSAKTGIAEQTDDDYDPDFMNNPPREYRESPMYQLFNGLSAFIYRPLLDPNCLMDFPVLHDLKKEGATDYLAFALNQSGVSGGKMVISFASYHPTGFGEESIDLLRRLMPILSILLELVNSRETTKVILDTYVGRRSGRLVMDGRIRRGDGEIIPAVVWLCDMRGFTQLANREKPQQLVSTLNDFFGCLVDSVDDAGGEVLKFMGDALLAIFPLPRGRRHFASAVCETALAAAEDAKEKLAKVNNRRRKGGKRVLEFGVSLHVGEVNYGNIGGSDRLDFTVLGSAVNLACRLQGLNAELGRVILVSDDFRELSKREFEYMGKFALKGIRGKRGVYALKR